MVPQLRPRRTRRSDVPAGPERGRDVATVRQSAARRGEHRPVKADYARHGILGHASSIQAASRLDRDVVGADGTRYAKGTAVPQRADFNTLDNPFAWSAEPRRDRFSAESRAGLHFVVFNPSSDDFRRVRLAMDGVLPDGTKVDVAPRSRAQGINSVLRTTHRQNFLVPPRERRSFSFTAVSWTAPAGRGSTTS